MLLSPGTGLIHLKNASSAQPKSKTWKLNFQNIINILLKLLIIILFLLNRSKWDVREFPEQPCTFAYTMVAKILGQIHPMYMRMFFDC